MRMPSAREVGRSAARFPCRGRHPRWAERRMSRDGGATHRTLSLPRPPPPATERPGDEPSPAYRGRLCSPREGRSGRRAILPPQPTPDLKCWNLAREVPCPSGTGPTAVADHAPLRPAPTLSSQRPTSAVRAKRRGPGPRLRGMPCTRGTHLTSVASDTPPRQEPPLKRPTPRFHGPRQALRPRPTHARSAVP